MEIKKGKATWIDIVQPTDDDIHWLQKKFHFHPLLLHELKAPSVRARVEAYDGCLYLIYHFPVYDPVEKVSRRQEINLIVTKNEVVTVRYENLEALEDFKKKLARPEFHEKVFGNTLHLTYHVIEALLAFNHRQLRHIQEKVEAVSLQLFQDREREVLTTISYLKRDISEYRIIVKPQDELLRSLLENGTRFWGENARIYMNDLLGDYLKLITHLEAFREAVSDFEDTNNQLMNVKTNEVQKTFTILAFLTFPFMLFAALFSMNTKYTPIVEHPYGFWIILVIMITGVVGMFSYFKNKDWL